MNIKYKPIVCDVSAINCCDASCLGRYKLILCTGGDGNESTITQCYQVSNYCLKTHFGPTSIQVLTTTHSNQSLPKTNITMHALWWWYGIMVGIWHLTILSNQVDPARRNSSCLWPIYPQCKSHVLPYVMLEVQENDLITVSYLEANDLRVLCHWYLINMIFFNTFYRLWSESISLNLQW
jgi:hypothetical protein